MVRANLCSFDLLDVGTWPVILIYLCSYRLLYTKNYERYYYVTNNRFSFEQKDLSSLSIVYIEVAQK